MQTLTDSVLFSHEGHACDDPRYHNGGVRQQNSGWAGWDKNFLARTTEQLQQLIDVMSSHQDNQLTANENFSKQIFGCENIVDFKT